MIKILCVGKIKEKYLQEFIEDYVKRIKKYHNIEIIEVKDDSSLDLEKERLEKYINSKDYVITFEINGKMVTSEEFSSRFETIFAYYSCITLVIGSSLGIHEDIKRRANEAISISKMTFPHGIFRGILLEQIYRSFKIINHETYHK